MNSTFNIANASHWLSVGLLLIVLFLTEAHAQPRLSLHMEPEFNGNLLKFPDGTFMAERYGELYRLSSDGKVERKLPFDRTHPIPEITAYNTWFGKLLAPLANGGFFAPLVIDIPLLGSVGRLAQFDRDGRLVSVDRSDRPYSAVGVQLSDGRILMGNSSNSSNYRAFELSCTGSFYWFPFGSTRAIALQGSKVVAAGNFSFSGSPTQTVALVRLNADLSLDSSFQPPLCNDVSHLAVQSDGRIIARGRLANDQGVFESEISVFRLNADGSFDRRIFQTASNDWQTPAFGIEPSGEIVILNSPNSEIIPNYPKLLRYHSDGTLKEMNTVQYSLPGCCGDWYGFDRIEFLAGGSFLAHYLVNNQGPSGIYPDHWVGFKSNGQLNPWASPLDYVNVYLSIANLIPNRDFYVEESKDLLLWERQGPSLNWGDVESIEKFHVKGPLRITEELGPHFFRVVQ